MGCAEAQATSARERSVLQRTTEAVATPYGLAAVPCEALVGIYQIRVDVMKVAEANVSQPSSIFPGTAIVIACLPCLLQGTFLS